MKPGIEWLIRVWTLGRARPVAGAYAELFKAGGDPRGRTVLADLASYCNVGSSSFVPGDPQQTAFNEGARDVYLHILEMSGLNPSDFPSFPTKEE